jgi:hypothetical protein
MSAARSVHHHVLGADGGIGVVLALKLTGTSFNMQAYIGIIMLAGIVVSNGILLVDYTTCCGAATACRCGKRSKWPGARGCARF